MFAFLRNERPRAAMGADLSPFALLFIVHPHDRRHEVTFLAGMRASVELLRSFVHARNVAEGTTIGLAGMFSAVQGKTACEPHPDD